MGPDSDCASRLCKTFRPHGAPGGDHMPLASEWEVGGRDAAGGFSNLPAVGAARVSPTSAPSMPLSLQQPPRQANQTAIQLFQGIGTTALGVCPEVSDNAGIPRPLLAAAHIPPHGLAAQSPAVLRLACWHRRLRNFQALRSSTTSDPATLCAQEPGWGLQAASKLAKRVGSRA